ncbi:MAG: hypothetical protein N2578_03650, partial [Bdellovibrionaceae bacterium]|nr:hypothetical protein [Pseudobdellovibrionaceae bacterium]
MFFWLFLSQITLGLTHSLPAEEPEFMPVALIRTEALADDGGEAPAFCNATFVSDRELVTAAHCLVYAAVSYTHL